MARPSIEAAPLRTYVQTIMPRYGGSQQLAKVTGVDEALIRRIVSGERARVLLDTADVITLRTEGAHVLNQLYPVSA